MFKKKETKKDEVAEPKAKPAAARTLSVPHLRIDEGRICKRYGNSLFISRKLNISNNRLCMG